MGMNSRIEWCDHTFNPIIGCTKVSPACANCYAERDFDHRLGKAKWGPQGTRIVTSEGNWQKPLKWNEKAWALQSWYSANRYVDAPRPRVFCASLADVFEDWDGEVLDHRGNAHFTRDGDPCNVVTSEHIAGCDSDGYHYTTMDDVRGRLFKLIDETPYLDWLLLTKRPENIRRMWRCKNDTDGDGGCGSCRNGICRHRENVWLGCSVENQEYANERIPELLKCRDLAPVLFLSCEPLLGQVDLTNIQISPEYSGVGPDAVADDLLDCLRGEICSGETGCMIKEGEPSVDWVIGGGESGPNARPSNPYWFHDLRDQCVAANVPFFFKQWGEWAPCTLATASPAFIRADSHAFDEETQVFRVGKKVAGRDLDGKTWDQVPNAKG